MTASKESLYDVLVSVLGADHAHTLMTSLPTDPPASKADINQLKGDVAQVRTDIREVRTELNDVRTEIKDVRTQIKDVRTELKGDINELRTELKGDINELRTDIRQLDARIHGFYDTIHAQTRVHVAASMGSAVTVAGLVFIAAQLV
ncbi:MAG: hypothetical protein ACRDVD_06790 [Acidimicrobiia bacterium]